VFFPVCWPGSVAGAPVGVIPAVVFAKTKPFFNKNLSGLSVLFICCSTRDFPFLRYSWGLQSYSLHGDSVLHVCLYSSMYVCTRCVQVQLRLLQNWLATKLRLSPIAESLATGQFCLRTSFYLFRTFEPRPPSLISLTFSSLSLARTTVEAKPGCMSGQS
jgi:hypothetical protein